MPPVQPGSNEVVLGLRPVKLEITLFSMVLLQAEVKIIPMLFLSFSVYVPPGLILSLNLTLLH